MFLQTNSSLFVYRDFPFSYIFLYLFLSVSIHMCFVCCYVYPREFERIIVIIYIVKLCAENFSVLLLLHCQTVCAEYQKSAVERDISIRPDTLDTVTEVVTQDSSIALEQSEKSKTEE